MTGRTLTARAPRADLGRLAPAGAAVGASLVAGAAVGSPTFARLGLVAALGAVVVTIGLNRPRALLFGLVGWLVLLGFTRRVLAGLTPATAIDPLLLVGPLALAILAVAAADRGAFRNRTALANAVLAYSVLTLFGAVNPLQGSLISGAAGLVFFAPLLAFWAGRALDDGTFRKLLWLVALAAVPAGAYGLLQTFRGFPSWDQAWIDRVGLTSLAVGDAVRPFSTFSAPSEYATFVAAALAVWLAFGLKGLRPTLSLPIVALLGVAVVYQSSRTILLLIAGAVGMMVGARTRLSLPLSVVLGAALLVALPLGVQRYAPADLDEEGHGSLIAHQVEGLSDPFDPKKSTALLHVDQVLAGMKSALREPAGQGLGLVTLGGSKFGGASGSAEADPGNAAVALGLPGLLVYFALLVFGYGTLYRVARTRRDGIALAALAICTLTLLQWLNGGQYAVAVLPWLALGWADAARQREAAA